MKDLLVGPRRQVGPARPEAQAAHAGVMDHEPGSALRLVLLTLEPRHDNDTCSWIAALVWECLVGNQLRLHHDAHGGIQRLYLVADGHDGPLGERHHPY